MSERHFSSLSTESEEEIEMIVMNAISHHSSLITYQAGATA